jgi:hypothetical protein
MKNTQSVHASFILLGSTLVIAILTSGCGKNESCGSVMGTATGAVLGAAVTNSKNRVVGAALGGLVGNLVGGSIGRAADEEEDAERQEHVARIQARRDAATQHEISRIRAENEQLKQRWCSRCNRQVTLTGANSCPSCGGELIRERYCRECSTVFSPTSGYRYCPYCKRAQALACR